MIHECVGRANLEIWNLETYVLQKAGNQEIQTLETSRRRSSGAGGRAYIYIYIYIFIIYLCIYLCIYLFVYIYIYIYRNP